MLTRDGSHRGLLQEQTTWSTSSMTMAHGKSNEQQTIGGVMLPSHAGFEKENNINFSETRFAWETNVQILYFGDKVILEDPVKRSNEMFKKIVKKVKDENFAPGVKDSLKKYIPDSKVVMGRAKRGLFAGRHIQYGNQISEDGGNKTRRTWKPNVQEKRLFSYILDRHIRVKVTTHALRCIDKAGGIDEYLLKTPYRRMDTEMGLSWKAKMEKMYAELGQMEVAFFSPEGEAKLEQGFKDMKLAERAARREARRKEYPVSGKQKLIEGEEEGEKEEAEGEDVAEAEEEPKAATA